MKTHSLSVSVLSAFVALIAVAPVAEAYIGPSEAFGGGSPAPITTGEATHNAAEDEESQFDRTDITTTYAPANKRSAAEQVAQQQRESKLRREQEEKALLATSASESDLHGAASDEEEIDTSRHLFEDDASYALRMERLAKANSNKGVTIIIGGNGEAAIDDQVLHSSAPRTAATGPETILMLSLLLLAGASTLGFGYMRKKQNLS